MNDTSPEEPQKPSLMDRGKKVVETAERTASVAERTSETINAIKWVAIAVVTLTFAGGAYGVYKVVSAPAKAVGNAAGVVTETVKTGTDKIKQSGSEVMNRLDIPASNQNSLNRAAEAAFKSLSTMAETEPDSMKERLYRRTNFNGHENRICKIDIKTEAVSIPAILAADNEAHATSKALGAKDNRLIRIILTAGKDDIALRAEWDGASQDWTMRWRATTIKKEVSDQVIEKRMIEALKIAAKSCK